jgi:cell division protein FtsQ
MTNRKLISIRFFLSVLVLVLLVSGLLWGWSVLKNPQIFPINEVKVEATYQHIDPQTIQHAMASYVNSSFFAVDITSIKKQLLQLPWVYIVFVNRVWPDKVIVKITEQTAVAQWNNNSLLNSNGEVFTPSKSTFPDNLPALFGPEDQVTEVWQYYQQMNQILTELGLKIIRVNTDDRGSWQLILNNDINLMLGNNNIMNKFYMFIKVYPKIIGTNSNRVISVDLRYANGLAIRWKK